MTAHARPTYPNCMHACAEPEWLDSQPWKYAETRAHTQDDQRISRSPWLLRLCVSTPHHGTFGPISSERPLASLPEPVACCSLGCAWSHKNDLHFETLENFSGIPQNLVLQKVQIDRRTRWGSVTPCCPAVICVAPGAQRCGCMVTTAAPRVAKTANWEGDGSGAHGKSRSGRWRSS